MLFSPGAKTGDFHHYILKDFASKDTATTLHVCGITSATRASFGLTM